MPDKTKNEREQSPNAAKLKQKYYERQLRKLQTKLVGTQEWVKATGARVIVIFEGHDAAG